MGWAARLFGAGAALRSTIGSAIDLIDQPEHERQMTILRAQLRAGIFAEMWSEGQALIPHSGSRDGLERVIQYVHQIQEMIPEINQPIRPLTSRQATKREFGGLTPREREVAARVAQGESNREIAETLIVTTMFQSVPGNL